MKIIYHHRTRAENAEGVHIREIVKAFRNEGHEVFVVAPPYIDTFKCENAITERKDSNCWALVSRYMPQLGFELLEIAYNLIAYYNIKRILRRNKIDFIYERYAFFGGMGAYLARKNNIPIVLEVNEVSGLKRTRGQILVGLANRIECATLRRAHAIVVVSSFLKDHIEKMGIESNRIYVIANGVDIKRFDPSITRDQEIKTKLKTKDKIVLGFVGNFVKWNNFEFFLDAFDKITKSYARNVVLMLVGDGPMKRKIEDFIKVNDLQNSVILTGNVSHGEIPQFIQLMDICIIPHCNEYRSPIKMFEYMAMSKPVVAPRIGSIEDVICDGENGVLFSLGNEDSLKDCLLNLINDGQKRKVIGEEARKTIISRYLWKYNAQKVIEIVTQIKN